jgi:hypothetical protein
VAVVRRADLTAVIDSMRATSDAALLEAFEEGEQVVGRLVTARDGGGIERCEAIQRPFLECRIGVDVGVDGLKFLVTKP